MPLRFVILFFVILFFLKDYSFAKSINFIDNAYLNTGYYADFKSKDSLVLGASFSAKNLFFEVTNKSTFLSYLFSYNKSLSPYLGLDYNYDNNFGFLFGFNANLTNLFYYGKYVTFYSEYVLKVINYKSNIMFGIRWKIAEN
jgi:hypothetical protein